MRLHFETKLEQKIYDIISEKYYVLARGPFVPEDATPWVGDQNNLARKTVKMLVKDLADFIKPRIR